MPTRSVTVELPLNVYEEVQAAQERGLANSVAEFIQEAVTEKLARVSWQLNLEELQREIERAGGLQLGDSKEEIIERLRQTRREIFEAEYAHLYRLQRPTAFQVLHPAEFLAKFA